MVSWTPGGKLVSVLERRTLLVLIVSARCPLLIGPAPESLLVLASGIPGEIDETGLGGSLEGGRLAWRFARTSITAPEL
jgi:hypothetical protein